MVQELGPNSLDMQGVGSNQTVNGLSWNCYDRLLTYAAKTLPDGTVVLRPREARARAGRELGGRADGMSCTFKLRKDATFHDGTPVTAKDVKWSFDRAVKVGGFPTFQMSAGSLEKPEQFVVVDDHTFRIDYRAQGQDAVVQRRGRRAVRHQFRTREEERDRRRIPGRWPG